MKIYQTGVQTLWEYTREPYRHCGNIQDRRTDTVGIYKTGVQTLWEYSRQAYRHCGNIPDRRKVSVIYEVTFALYCPMYDWGHSAHLTFFRKDNFHNAPPTITIFSTKLFVDIPCSRPRRSEFLEILNLKKNEASVPN